MLECLAAANPAPTLKELGPGLLLPDASEAAALPPRCVPLSFSFLYTIDSFQG